MIQWHGPAPCGTRSSSMSTVQPSRVIGASSWRAEKMRLDCLSTTAQRSNVHGASSGALRIVAQQINSLAALWWHPIANIGGLWCFPDVTWTATEVGYLASILISLCLVLAQGPSDRRPFAPRGTLGVPASTRRSATGQAFCACQQA
jgi:hypothetical protein